MNVYPAIDLLGGRCVRLKYGDYDRETRYESDPVEVAHAFEAAGASWIHVVDLDAARGDGPVNKGLIDAIVAAVEISVQVGGGVRDDAAAMALFDVGVERVIVGTAAVRDPDLVARLAGAGCRVAVGLDVRDGDVAIEGWRERSGHTLDEMLARFANVGADATIITFIDRDGTLSGPDVGGYSSALRATSLAIIASGGVGSVEDIDALGRLSAGGSELEGVIVGKALHDGVMTMKDAIRASGRGRGEGSQS